MIGRIWHGWTSPENADRYEILLKTEVLPGIAAMNLRGYRDVQEFITIMRFDSLEAVRQFAGKDYEQAHVPAKAREVLARFDQRSQHYEIVEELSY
jgi:heme-degrading monooxygenase HmoA